MRQISDSQLRDREAILSCEGNVTRAAEIVGVTAKALHKRLQASAQAEWWMATRKKFREDRKKARLRRSYAKLKARRAQEAASAYLAALENSSENGVT